MGKTGYHHGNLRSVLLEHALQELKENGVEALSLRKVARRAGVSHAAPAHHFGNARGLLTALTARGFRLFAEALAAARGRAKGQGQNALTAAGVGYVEFALAHPELFSLMFASAKPDFGEAELDAASMIAFEHFLAAVEESGAGRASDETGVNVAAMKAWSTVHGLAVLLLTKRMRSVLALPEAERSAALRRILDFDD